MQLDGGGSSDRNPRPSKLDFKISSLDPIGNFDCRASVNFLLAVSKRGGSNSVITPCAIGGGLESLRSSAMRRIMATRAVGLKTNKPKMVAAIRTSADKNQIPARFTLAPLSESYCSCITLS